EARSRRGPPIYAGHSAHQMIIALAGYLLESDLLPPVFVDRRDHVVLCIRTGCAIEDVLTREDDEQGARRGLSDTPNRIDIQRSRRRGIALASLDERVRRGHDDHVRSGFADGAIGRRAVREIE